MAPLPKALTEVLDDPSVATCDLALEALNREIANLKTAEIASFMHPNEAGARRYADVIVERHNRYRRQTVKADLRRLAQGGGQAVPPSALSVKQTLRRYGLDPATGLRACLQHMVVDSLAVETTVAGEVRPPGLLVVVGQGHEWEVLKPEGLIGVPGDPDLFAIDTRGGLHLGDIDRLVVQVIGTHTFIELSSIALSVNGKLVFRASAAEAASDGTTRLTFAYPS